MKAKLIGVGVVLAVLLFVLFSSAYVVEEGRQAVITQFGKPVNFTTEAGLHFRIPFIQQTHILEKRMLPWDGAAKNMQTRDKKRIFIDVWARWQIVDVQTFFQAVGTQNRGQKILDDIVDSAVQDVVARNNLIDVVRSTDDKLIYEDEEATQSSSTRREAVTSGRVEMETQILKVASAGLKERYGIELRDVHLKRVNYFEAVKETVYERMRSERMRIAQLYESEAEEEKNKIEGVTRKELDLLQGEMEQKSAEIRGQAEAEVIRLTAEGYGQSLEFYRFIRGLEALKKSLGKDTRLILSTDSELLRLIKQPDAQPATSQK